MLYPIGIQSFEYIRKNGYVYVDKTLLIHKLATTGKHYFLSRPRRFGKSLLVSTMEAYFSGRKELFEGLEISQKEQEWVKYPILHIDLSGKAYDSPDVLLKVLDNSLMNWENQYGIKNLSDVPGLRLGNIIEAASRQTGSQVVILIDEYDKPIVDNLSNTELSDTFSKQLQGFYSAMKSNDEFIKFSFLTGVTKIGKLNIFSGLNNLKDISMDSRYTDICGISEKDLKHYFKDSVNELAVANDLTEEECYLKLAEMYDGYHFRQDSIGVYNPFSVLNTFDSKEFKEYWSETGTPSFLVELMKKTSYDVTRLTGDEVDSTLLSGVNSDLDNPVPFLYQAGYLTIKDYDKAYNLYKLGFPNREVKDGFLNYLLNFYAPVQTESTNSLIARMSRDIRSGKAEGFLQKLEALFAKTSYQIQGNSEKDFQYAMYIILELMGEYVEVEKTTSEGRIDILLQTDSFIYVIEIKTDGSAEAALKQIEDKAYTRPFRSDSRKIFKIGVNFSSKTRCIDSWEIAG